MRLIDADRLKAVIDKNIANKRVKDVINQYVDMQPTIKICSASDSCSDYIEESDK